MTSSCGERLKRHERINDSLQIRQIRNLGERFSGRQIRVFRQSNPLRGARLAVALTKKAGSSVVRNRSRRKIREFFRKNKEIMGSFDYFFFSDQDISSLAKAEWHEFFQAILKWCRGGL